MTIGFIFWLLLLLALIFNCVFFWWSGPAPGQPNQPVRVVGWIGLPLFWVILFVLLGLGVFGCPIETPPARPAMHDLREGR